MRFNNSLRSRGVKRCIGYVVQDDIFFCNLTVRETLTVSAMLKLPDTMSEGEKTEQVNHTLRSLGIEHCADTIIGGPFNRGISGGERKRVNIGTQLVHYPSILLLDEPTSGLDSTTSLNLMMTLRQLANGGRTIITTLHQPSSQMFMLFNSLLVMSRGRVMYHGSRPHVLGYFGSLGYKCRPNYNPADFLLELASKKQEVCTELAEAFVQHADSEQYGRSKIVYRRLANAWSRKHTRAQADTASSSLHAPSASASSSSSVALTEVGLRLDARSEPDDKDNGEGECKHNKTLNEPTTRTAVANNEHAYDKDRDDEGTGEKEQVQEQEQVEFATDVDMPTSWWTQFKVLCKRSYTQKKGSYITPISIIELTFLTVFTSLIWFQISDDESSIEDRLGVLFFSDVYWAFNLVNAALGMCMRVSTVCIYVYIYTYIYVCA